MQIKRPCRLTPWAASTLSSMPQVLHRTVRQVKPKIQSDQWVGARSLNPLLTIRLRPTALMTGPATPVRQSACLPVCLPRLSACLPVRLSACLPVCPPACLPVSLSACPPVRLPARPPACPSARLPVCLSACPPVCLSACPPVRLSACPGPRLQDRHTHLVLRLLPVAAASSLALSDRIWLIAAQPASARPWTALVCAGWPGIVSRTKFTPGAF